MLRYKEIKQMLLNEISQRNPLDRLPSRLELCKKLDTTRTTLDKAIKELESEGIVFCRDGSGTYVAIPEGYDIKKPENWGIIVPDIMEDIYAGLVRGVEDFAQRNGVNLILCNFDHDPEKQEQYIRRLMLTGVSGIILVPVLRQHSTEVANLYSVLADAKKPLVLCNMGVQGIEAPIVTSNNYYGGYLATKHLIQRGYQKIAYLSKFNYQTSIERCQGYITALMEAGRKVDRELIIIDAGAEEQPYGYTAIKKLLKMRPDVDAVFCFNDSLVRGVYQAAQELGKRISDDLGVIGYDNAGFCTDLKPEASTMTYRNTEIGHIAADLLLKQINGEALSGFQYYLFKPELIERESCLGPRNAG